MGVDGDCGGGRYSSTEYRYCTVVLVVIVGVSLGVNLGLVSRLVWRVVVCYWYATELVQVLYDALVSYITFTHHPTLHLLR